MDSSPQFLNLPDGTRLACELAGEGPPLVLVLGLGGVGGFWAPIRPLLGARLRVLTLDQRGLGSSSRGVAPVSIGQLARDVAAAAAAQGWTRFALAGHSTGAAVAVTLAGDFGPQDEPPPQEAARLRQVWEERIAALLAFDGRGLAPRLACPTLVLGAVDDALIPHTHQQATAAAIPGARLVSLPGGGHFFPVTRRDDYAAAPPGASAGR
jgi:aminoacrylate hydrolase